VEAPAEKLPREETEGPGSTRVTDFSDGGEDSAHCAHACRLAGLHRGGQEQGGEGGGGVRSREDACGEDARHLLHDVILRDSHNYQRSARKEERGGDSAAAVDRLEAKSRQGEDPDLTRA
jgi:hypothetical protein